MFIFADYEVSCKCMTKRNICDEAQRTPNTTSLHFTGILSTSGSPYTQRVWTRVTVCESKHLACTFACISKTNCAAVTKWPLWICHCSLFLLRNLLIFSEMLEQERFSSPVPYCGCCGSEKRESRKSSDIFRSRPFGSCVFMHVRLFWSRLFHGIYSLKIRKSLYYL